MRVTSVSAVEFDEQTPGTWLEEVCCTLYNIAQKHTPGTAFADATELANITKLLQANSIPVQPAVKAIAATNDYSPAVLKHSEEYRLLHAKYTASLSTIADLGSRKIRKNKSEFHAGITEGLRRAAKIAIMFLQDLDAPLAAKPDKNDTEQSKTTIAGAKSGRSFVR
jgi:hypothetical protein